MNLDNPLLAGFIDTPSLVSADHQAHFESCLSMFLRLEHADAMLAAGMGDGDNFWPEAGSWEARYRPYSVKSGILSIPVQGVLLNNFGYATSWATGYQYLARAWQRGQADPDVKGIALVIDSPGGHTSGNFDLVDKMFADKGNKPVWAIVENGYSAAYSIASLGDEVHVSRTGGLGSIGVVTGHMDVSEAMKKAGIKMTLVSAPEGGDKTAQSPYEPLSEDARQRMQVKVDEIYGHFVGAVSRHRGMSEKDVRATKARTFSASQSLALGLADKISSPDESMAAFSAALSPKSSKETSMSTVELAVHEAAVNSARNEGLIAGRAEGQSEGRAAGLREGATSERERINGILALEEAKDRPMAALSCALQTDLSVDNAKGFLARLPKEAAAAPAGGQSRSSHANALFREAMDASGGAGVKGGEGGEQASDPDDAGPTLALARAAGILPPKKTS